MELGIFKAFLIQTQYLYRLNTYLMQIKNTVEEFMQKKYKCIFICICAIIKRTNCKRTTTYEYKGRKLNFMKQRLEKIKSPL